MGDSGFFNIHKVFQAPVLPGIPEVEFNLEAQSVELDDFVIGQIQLGEDRNTLRERTGDIIKFRTTQTKKWGKEILKKRINRDKQDEKDRKSTFSSEPSFSYFVSLLNSSLKLENQAG